MWYFMQQSGVHPTITGVLLSFCNSFGDGGENSPLQIVTLATQTCCVLYFAIVRFS